MCFVVVAADGMDAAIMGFVTPSILQEWDVSKPAFGTQLGNVGATTKAYAAH
jgi:hypothetical protein